MALCAENEQTACGADLIRLVLDLILIFIFKLPESFSCVKNLLIIRFRKALCFGDHLFRDLHFFHLGCGKELRVTAEHNIGTAPRHIRGDRNSAELTGLRDDLRLALMILGIEHIVRNTCSLEHFGKQFALFNADRAHKYGLTGIVTFLDLLDNMLVFCSFRLENNIGQVLSDQGLVGGYLNNIQLIDLAEFLRFRGSRTRHARKLLIKPEVILESDGSKRFALVLYLNALFCFDCLMQTVVITSAEHDTAGELVYYEYLTVLDNIIDITAHYADCFYRLIDVVKQRCVLHIHKVFNAEILLRLFNTALGKRCRARLFIHNEIAVIGCFRVLFFIHLGNLIHF